jgi:DNA-binding NarL/FixJ family response regulator
LQDHTLRDDPHNLTFAYYLLSQLAWTRGQYEAARDYARQGYETAARSSEALRANILQQWGTASQLLGDFADAKQRLKAAYVILKELGEPEGMSSALLRLGRIGLHENDYAESRRCFEQALMVGYGFNDPGTIAMSLAGMGNSTCAMRQYGEARRFLREALQLSIKAFPINLPPVFIGIGDLFLQTGKRARGIELLTVAQHYPSINQALKDRARGILNRHEVSEEPEQRTLTPADFDIIAAAVVDELLADESKSATSQSALAGETLIEPLSERELEVFTLIADGLSNRQVADQLFLSVATVKWYLTHIYGKLGVQSRTQALVRARQLSLIP